MMSFDENAYNPQDVQYNSQDITQGSFSYAPALLITGTGIALYYGVKYFFPKNDEVKEDKNKGQEKKTSSASGQQNNSVETLQKTVGKASPKVKNNLSITDTGAWQVQNFGCKTANEMIDTFNLDNTAKVSDTLRAADSYLETELNAAETNTKTAANSIVSMYSTVFADAEYKKENTLTELKLDDKFSNVSEIKNVVENYYNSAMSKSNEYKDKAIKAKELEQKLNSHKDDLKDLRSNKNVDQKSIESKDKEIQDTNKELNEVKTKAASLSQQNIAAYEKLQQLQKHYDTFVEQNKISEKLKEIKGAQDYTLRIDSIKKHWFEEKKKTFKGTQDLLAFLSVWKDADTFVQKLDGYKTTKLSMKEYAASNVNYAL